MHYHTPHLAGENRVISYNQADREMVVVVKPNHSATWHQNLWLLAALAIPSLGAGIGFALAGAWPILPLAGLELDGTGWRAVLGELEARVPTCHSFKR